MLTASGQTKTVLLDPIGGEAMVPDIAMDCIAMGEAMAEKFRAALSRRDVAIRDFYDLDYAVSHLDLDPADPRLIEMVRQKLAVPGNSPVDVGPERHPSFHQAQQGLGRQSSGSMLPWTGRVPSLAERPSGGQGFKHGQQKRGGLVNSLGQTGGNAFRGTLTQERIPLSLLRVDQGKSWRQRGGLRLELSPAVEERLRNCSGQDLAVKVEVVREEPEVRKVLHTTVAFTKADHRLKLLGDHGFATIDLQARRGKTQDRRILCLLRRRDHDI